MPFDQLEGPVEEGTLSQGERALASLPPVSESVKVHVEAADVAEPEVVVVDQLKQQAPSKPTATTRATKATAEAATSVPAEAKPQEPFFGRPPDDPGVKDPLLATAEPKTRLKLF
jgi:HemY protein